MEAEASQNVSSQLIALNLELDNLWIIVSCILVFLMQAGFMFLEIGFSRRKNVGTGVAKVFVNFATVTIAWWAVGYAISSASGGLIAGDQGFFFHFGQTVGEAVNAGPEANGMLFGLAFCAVSLAIVWGTTLERINFAAYAIFAVIFGAIIYPLVAHSVWSGFGLLDDIGGKEVLDFAGSSVVHLTGATAAFAALLLLGPRKGKYDKDGNPRAIPGHSMPLVGLGVMLLWIGWFGFNGGSALATDDVFFAEVALNTQLGAAAGVIGALLTVWFLTKTIDVGMAGNGAIAGLVAITAGCGYVEYWAAPIIGFVGGIVVVVGVLAIEKRLDDPVGALSAHGLAGIWGTLAVGLFGAPRLVGDLASPGVWYGIFGDQSLGAAFGQLGVQAVGVVGTFAFVLVASLASFAAIKAIVGLRVTGQDEESGLDIASHGMYGYPEVFIPQPEYPVAGQSPHVAGTPVASSGGTPTRRGMAAKGGR